MNEPQAFAQTDAEWLASINRARDWFQGPLGSLMLAEERRLLCDELTRYFGGYLVHYGPHAELPPSTGQIQRGVRLGPPLPGVDIACEGASGAIVRRLRRQPGNRAWLAWSAGATPGSLRAPASIYWWHASWSWGCARCARASANRAVSWCPCRWRKSAGEIPKFRHDR